MSYQLRNESGTVEAVIDDNCGMKKFYSIANTLATDLKVKFTEKQDQFDSVDWNFKYKGHPMKLHYNIYNGVSIFPGNIRDNDAVTELASMLERKFF
jgi:hypothetical protein